MTLSKWFRASSGVALLAMVLSATILSAAPVSLRGRVQIDGVPATDLAIAASSGKPEHAARTDPDGRFAFAAPLAAGPIRLVLQVDAETVHHEYVTLAESVEAHEVTIDLTRARVRGRIIDQRTGEPIDDAEVTLTRVPGSAAPRVSSVHTRTTPDGGFDLRPTAPGRYTMVLRRNGYGAVERILALGQGAVIDDTEVLMTPLTDADLTVAFVGNTTPRNLQIALFDEQNRMIAMGTGGDQPVVRLAGVPAGTWRLVAFAEGTATHHTTWQVPGEPPALALGPEARIAIEVPALMASPGQGATLAVRSPAGVSLLIPWASQHSETWPLVNGTRTIGQLPPGQVLVEVRAADGRTWQAEATTVAAETAVLVLE